MLAEVGSRLIHVNRAVTKHANTTVAGIAKETTDTTSGMAMIHAHPVLALTADFTVARHQRLILRLG
jgi:hypothetical protein